MTTENMTICGTVRCHRLQQYRRRRTGAPTIGDVVADLIAPLPPRELWVVEDSERTDYAGRPQFYRTKSGRLPAGLTADMEGAVVTLRARVDLFDNGLGGFLIRVRPDTVRLAGSAS